MGEAGRSLDVQTLLGVWIATDPDTRGIARVEITDSADSENHALGVRIFAAGTPGGETLLDWGTVETEALFADGPDSRRGMSFTARYRLGFLETHLQGNCNLGLLVLAAFNDFQDASGRSSYFSREFFYREDGAAIGRPVSPVSGEISRAEDGVSDLAGGPEIDPTPLLGTWKNTNPEPKGIARIALADDDGVLSVRVLGVDPPREWGEARGGVYAKDPASRKALGFSSLHETGSARVHLQANIKQGVLVVAMFNEMPEGSGRSSYFSREFFYL